MKPEQRLAKMRARIGNRHSLNLSDYLWLLDREKRLSDALQHWHDKFCWRTFSGRFNRDEYEMHHIEESVIQECVAKGKEALRK